MTKALLIALLVRLMAAGAAALIAKKKGQNVLTRSGLTAAFPVVGLVLGIFGENRNAVKDITQVPKNANEAKELLSKCQVQRNEIGMKLMEVEKKLENTRNPVMRFIRENRKTGYENLLATCDRNLEKAYGHCERLGLAGLVILPLADAVSDGEKLGRSRDGNRMKESLEHVRDLSRKKRRPGRSIMDLLGK